MNLNEPERFIELDRQNILSKIDDLPTDLETGWQQGHQHELPDWHSIRQIVLSGVGTGLLAADMISGYACAVCPVPLHLQRDGDLPAWVQGEHTLVIPISSSGNSDESLSACQTARERNCRVLGIGGGGKLAGIAPLYWGMDFSGHAALAVGRLSGMLLASLHRLGLLSDAQNDLQSAVSAMLTQRANLNGGSPLASNPAKRQAGQMMGRWVKVVGSGWMAPVARSWKHHLNLLSKAWAQHEVLPEAAHNMIFGLLQPEEQLPRSMVVFLRAPGEPRQDRLRTNMTRKLMMLEGIGTDTYDAAGDTPLAHQWTGLQFGCYTAYYLAMCYQIDPSPAGVVETLQEDLNKHKPS